MKRSPLKIYNNHNDHVFEDLLRKLDRDGLFASLKVPQGDVFFCHPEVVVRPVLLPAPAHHGGLGQYVCDGDLCSDGDDLCNDGDDHGNGNGNSDNYGDFGNSDRGTPTKVACNILSLVFTDDDDDGTGGDYNDNDHV